MKVVAVIPARYSSKRFPGKVLVPISGKPMIQWVWERVGKASLVEEVIIATDDERVQKTAEGFGAHVIMTNPDHGTGTERVAEAAAKLNPEVVVNVQGDEPLIEPESLDLLVQPFIAGEEVAVCSLMHPIENCRDFLNPNIVKVVCDETDFAVYFSRHPIPYYRDGAELLAQWEKEGKRPPELKPVPMKHIGVYAFEAEFLQALVRMPRTDLEVAERLEQLRVLAWGFRIKMIKTPYDAVSVDVPEDVEKVEELIRRKGLA